MRLRAKANARMPGHDPIPCTRQGCGMGERRGGGRRDEWIAWCKGAGYVGGFRAFNGARLPRDCQKRNSPLSIIRSFLFPAFFFFFFFSFFFRRRCFFPPSGGENHRRIIGPFEGRECERSAGLCSRRLELAREFPKDRNFLCFCLKTEEDLGEYLRKLQATIIILSFYAYFTVRVVQEMHNDVRIFLIY